MRTWTRGEKIGCGSMVLGAFTTLAVLASVPAVQRFFEGWSTTGGADRSSAVGHEGSAQLLFEQQRKLLAEQTAAAREELRRLHEERIKLRQARIEILADRHQDREGQRYDTILLHNTCDHPIDVALYYRDLDEAWITRGWWGVKPGETVTTNAYTKNAYLYFFAENRNVGRIWDGTDKEESLSLQVVDAKFDHLEGETFVYEGARTVSFYRRETSDAWGDQTEKFECLLEAPLPRPAEQPAAEATPQGATPGAG
jgi:uncharacterized membrane protein